MWSRVNSTERSFQHRMIGEIYEQPRAMADTLAGNLNSVIKRLVDMPGVVAYWVLPDEERDSLRRLETESNFRLRIPGMEIVNEGINEVLDRQHVIVISHSPALRHPPGPIMVICDEEGVVGEEVSEPGRFRKLSTDPNAIMVGGSLVLYRDALLRAKSKPLKLVYGALRFPELEELKEIQDVISVTIGAVVHVRLAQKAGWDVDDPNLGTVLIGFNDSTQGTHLTEHVT